MNEIPILLWLYHNDLAQEFYSIFNKLTNIQVYLGLCIENDNTDTIKLFSSLPSLRSIDYYQNTGADILPFLYQLQQIDAKKYPYFIKLHSKKSQWGHNLKCNWRSMLVDSLIGDNHTLKNNIKYIQKNTLGSIGCGSLIYNKNQSVHKEKIREISNLCKIDPSYHEKFIGGNMFIGDTELYQNKILPNFSYMEKLLSTEVGKVNETVNGTYCHAMERIFGYIGCIKGLQSCPLNTINIKIFDTKLQQSNIDILHLRIMYNNEVYCIENPSIYGRVVLYNNYNLKIEWLQNNQFIMANYTRVDHNTYANSAYFINGVLNV